MNPGPFAFPILRPVATVPAVTRPASTQPAAMRRAATAATQPTAQEMAGGFPRDSIAVLLCQALAATHDEAAIRKAKALRKDFYETDLLGR